MRAWRWGPRTGTVALPWETWWATIAALRAKGLLSMPQHADYLARQRDRHPADRPTVALELTDDAYLRSFAWALAELGIPVPEEYREDGRHRSR